MLTRRDFLAAGELTAGAGGGNRGHMHARSNANAVCTSNLDAFARHQPSEPATPG